MTVNEGPFGWKVLRVRRMKLPRAIHQNGSMFFIQMEQNSLAGLAVSLLFLLLLEKVVDVCSTSLGRAICCQRIRGQ